ncbi:hypothetical protein GQ44DRAFT_809724 [Phaeosphaeriaceae sp. PMI808]|nr:hypothetical protein GQ44DRAFT_809724 [Phaeosphaeriaceae sp. PMI808]
MHSTNLPLVLSFLARLLHAQEVTWAPRHETSILLRRDGTPTASCPEQFGNPPMNCDSPACGGQAAAGVCKNNSGGGKSCQCQAGAPAPTPTNTMVTATNAAGSTIIGIYQLITIDKYKSLRQEQTVTISQTTTGSDGQPTVAAAAAVVAAGGVAWILGTSADAAGAAILKPPPKPEASKDDPSCPAQKHKCKDCGAIPEVDVCIAPDGGCACEPEKKCPVENAKPECIEKACTGLNGKCTTGEHNGCSCKGCPTGDQQPQCDDEQKCKGKDGKCTVGDNAGCGCKQSPCPEPRYTPFCDFCGGKGNDGKCNGIAAENHAWKGCKCWDFAPGISEPPKVGQFPITEDIPDATPSSYSYGGDDPLKCLNLGYGAKHEDIKKSATDWCKSVNGKKVTKTGDGDVLYKRFAYDYYSYWLGAQYDGASGGNCGDSADVKEINCVSTMLEELDDCNSGDPEFKGAELTDGCVKYHISLSRSTNDNDPPFKQLPQNSPECAKGDVDVTPVAFNFWQGVSKKFCNDVGDGKSAKKAELKNTDLQTRSLFRRTPPPSSKSYPDWKFFFEWEPKGSGSCAKTCEEAMGTFANSCGHYGGQQNSMVKKGSIEVGCGKYSYSLEGPPKAPPPAPPAPESYCSVTYGTFFLHFWVGTNKGWGGDDGAAFQKEVKGCGAVTGWSLGSSNPPDFEFNLPVTMKSGCVERAIKSAGGPAISCVWKSLTG